MVKSDLVPFSSALKTPQRQIVGPPLPTDQNLNPADDTTPEPNQNKNVKPFYSLETDEKPQQPPIFTSLKEKWEERAKERLKSIE